MSKAKRDPEQVVPSLKQPLRLTRMGMTAERLIRAFWPFYSLLFAALAVLMLGGLSQLSLEMAWIFVAFWAMALIAVLVQGVRQFQIPRQAEARARLDKTLTGRPIAALADQQAIGAGDPASEAIWAAHLARMSDRVASAKAAKPDLRMAKADPYALRYVAVLALSVGVIFGSVWRIAHVADLGVGSATAAVPTGPSWEGWIEPPAYTGLPSLYLNDIAAGPLRLPQGSRLTLRLYGEIGALTVSETVSGRTGEVPSAFEPVQEFTVAQAGMLSINKALKDLGPEDQPSWQITMVPDRRPEIQLIGLPETTLSGEFSQPFYTQDDYGIIQGQAGITLNLGDVDRRFGLALPADARDPIALDLPLTIAGDRSGFEGEFVENFEKHPWANLPVTLTLTVQDALGQQGQTVPSFLTLPGRRFFDPLAQAVIEQRRDLLWARANSRRVGQVLRALTYAPDDVVKTSATYLKLRHVIRQLEQAGAVGLDADKQSHFAEVLWHIAVQIEDGDLGDALERLHRAQDRLSEAMQQGASDSEIAELMQELRDAMQDYIQQLAEETSENPDDQQQADAQNTLEITSQDLQAMMDRLQELIQQGRMSEAQQLMDQLRQMMENMQVTRGQGNSQQSEGQQAMEGLADTLRQQQGLSDQAFRDLQDQFDPGANANRNSENQGQTDGEGEGRAEGESQQGTGRASAPPSAQDLGDRQQALRQQLNRQRQNTPGAGTRDGVATDEALSRAEQAMDQAEDALRQQDLAGALDRQAEAMDALRDGLRELGDQIAENQQQTDGQQGEALGDASQQSRDPLGRKPGAEGGIGTDDTLLQGEDIYRRARDLLDEIRNRSGDQSRPDIERSYLKRLLDRF